MHVVARRKRRSGGGPAAHRAFPAHEAVTVPEAAAKLARNAALYCQHLQQTLTADLGHVEGGKQHTASGG